MRNSRWHPTLLIRASIVLHLLAVIVLTADPGQWRWVLGAVLVNHALLTLLGLWPRSHWLGPNWTRLPAGAAARNEIALTIDDGPDPIVTPQVLDMLDRYATQATFFCIGHKAARYPDLCSEIVRRGHAVENHSQHHHHHFALLGPSGFRRELQTAQDTLTRITGQHPWFFRAPAGLRNPFLEPALCRSGLRLVSWTRRGFDTLDRSPRRVAARLTKGLRAGDILVAHDGGSTRTPSGVPVVLEVLPRVLDSVAERGLRAARLDSLIRDD